MVRLLDRAVVLIPQRTPDPNNAAVSRVDWTVPPEEIPVPFEGQAQRGGGGDLEQGTTLATWSGWLPPLVRIPESDEDDAELVDVDLTTRFGPACRLTWHGSEYSVDGPVRMPRKRGRIRYLAFTFKRADKRPT